jgi:hypothetical protein
MIHHAADRRCEIVGQQVDRPDDAAAAIALGEDLDRRVVMRGPALDDRIDQAAASSSIVTSRSRATRPLKKVTMRSPLSISSLVRKPGATRVCTAPKSRIA